MTVFGVLRVWHGALSAGDLIVFVSYTRKAHSPMRSFAREATKLTAALARADRVAEVLSADEVLLEDGRAYHGGRARGEIELDDVSLRLRRRAARAASDVSLHRRSRRARRARRPVRRRQVDARARSSPASTTRPRAPC